MRADELKTELESGCDIERLANNAQEVFDAACEYFLGERNSLACSLLSLIIRKKEYRDRLNSILTDRAILHECLSSSEPKLRKNAAKLCGGLRSEKDLSALIDRLNKEQTRMVIPSVILAIGAIGGDEAKSALNNYTVMPPKDETENKHYNEELAALSKAISKLTEIKKHEFIGLDTEYEVKLTCSDGAGKALYDSMKRSGYEVAGFDDNSASVLTSEYNKLFKCRLFKEAWVKLKIKTDDFTEACNAVADFMERTHSGNPPYMYRFASKNRDGINLNSSDKLVNSTSAYEIQIRHEKDEVYVRLHTYEDKRFNYRLKSIPASIHPTTAAYVFYLASDYLKTGASVLDICCGSGTLLIERARHSKTGLLTGIDISKSAVEIAVQNASAANVSASFYCRDCTKFYSNKKYDEIIGNLPFGNRVGRHSDNVDLYAGLLRNADKLLNDDGVMILYTMESKLLERMTETTDKFSIISKTSVEAGGLYPNVFVMKKRKDSVKKQ